MLIDNRYRKRSELTADGLVENREHAVGILSNLGDADNIRFSLGYDLLSPRDPSR